MSKVTKRIREQIYCIFNTQGFNCYDLRVTYKTFIPVSKTFGNEDNILIFSRNVRKQVVS